MWVGTLRYHQVVSPVQLHAAAAHLACIKSSADFGVLYKYFGVLYKYISCLPVVQPFGCRMHADLLIGLVLDVVHHKLYSIWQLDTI